jgi:hypothetical protein
MAEWRSKVAGAVLRIAGLMHIALLDRPEYRPIDVTTIRAAIRVGAYFDAHARIMFRIMHGRQGQSDAASILDVLRRINGDRITYRDLWQRVKGRAGFDHAELAGALATLEEHGWIRRETLPAKQGKAPGGRQSEVIHLNPAIHAQNSQNFPAGPQPSSSESFEHATQAFSASHNVTPLTQLPEPLQPTGTDNAGWEVY